MEILQWDRRGWPGSIEFQSGTVVCPFDEQLSNEHGNGDVEGTKRGVNGDGEGAFTSRANVIAPKKENGPMKCNIQPKCCCQSVREIFVQSHNVSTRPPAPDLEKYLIEHRKHDLKGDRNRV